jgi:hypothetical protein
MPRFLLIPFRVCNAVIAAVFVRRLDMGLSPIQPET